MLLNEKELKIVLEFVMTPLLKQYSIYIKEAHIFINDKIEIQSVIIYQDHVIDLNASFLLDYHNHHICFTDIDGKIEYLFLQLNLIKVLNQLLNHENIKIKEDSCFYCCELPIQSIEIHNHCLSIQLK